MNPLINLIGTKFKDLTANELMQVVQNYCDQNKYEFDYDLNYKTRQDVVSYFESNFYGIHELKTYFKYSASQRSGIFLLLSLIIVFQLVYFFVDFLLSWFGFLSLIYQYKRQM